MFDSALVVGAEGRGSTNFLRRSCLAWLRMRLDWQIHKHGENRQPAAVVAGKETTIQYFSISQSTQEHLRFNCDSRALTPKVSTNQLLNPCRTRWTLSTFHSQEQSSLSIISRMDGLNMLFLHEKNIVTVTNTPGGISFGQQQQQLSHELLQVPEFSSFCWESAQMYLSWKKYCFPCLPRCGKVEDEMLTLSSLCYYEVEAGWTHTTTYYLYCAKRIF